jgi:hypothetical protein
LAALPFIGLTYPPPPNILVPLPTFKRQTVVLGFITGCNIFFKVAVSVTPFLLVAYWYTRLFSNFGYHDFALYLSAALSAYLLLYTVFLVSQAGVDGILNQKNVVKGQF